MASCWSGVSAGGLLVVGEAEVIPAPGGSIWPATHLRVRRVRGPRTRCARSSRRTSHPTGARRTRAGRRSRNGHASAQMHQIVQAFRPLLPRRVAHGLQPSRVQAEAAVDDGLRARHRARAIAPPWPPPSPRRDFPTLQAVSPHLSRPRDNWAPTQSPQRCERSPRTTSPSGLGPAATASVQCDRCSATPARCPALSCPASIGTPLRPVPSAGDASPWRTRRPASPATASVSGASAPSIRPQATERDAKPSQPSAKARVSTQYPASRIYRVATWRWA